MENIANKNESSFNQLKQRYPNLANFNFKNNYIAYTEASTSAICFLGNVSLDSLESSLFSLTPNEIFYILNNICLMINNPNEIDKKVKYTGILLGFATLENEHITYIYNYLNDYHNRQNMHEKYSYPGDTSEIQKIEIPVHKSYDESLELYNNPGAIYIRKYEEQYYENKLATGESSSKEKAYVRTLKSNHNTVEIEPAYTSIAGFMSATFIISLVLILGIVLAVILFAIKF